MPNNFAIATIKKNSMTWILLSNTNLLKLLLVLNGSHYHWIIIIMKSKNTATILRCGNVNELKFSRLYFRFDSGTEIPSTIFQLVEAYIFLRFFESVKWAVVCSFFQNLHFRHAAPPWHRFRWQQIYLETKTLKKDTHNFVGLALTKDGHRPAFCLTTKNNNISSLIN